MAATAPIRRDSLTQRTNDEPTSAPTTRPAVKLYDPWEIRFNKHYEPVRLDNGPDSDHSDNTKPDQSAA
jgi:hypothetical protein